MTPWINGTSLTWLHDGLSIPPLVPSCWACLPPPPWAGPGHDGPRLIHGPPLVFSSAYKQKNKCKQSHDNEYTGRTEASMPVTTKSKSESHDQHSRRHRLIHEHGPSASCIHLSLFPLVSINSFSGWVVPTSLSHPLLTHFFLPCWIRTTALELEWLLPS
jgi:hypothetical protein